MVIAPTTVATAEVTKATDSNSILDGRDHTYNKKTVAKRAVSVATTNPTVSSAPYHRKISVRPAPETRTMIRPSTMPVDPIGPPNRSISTVSVQMKQVERTEPPQPAIRVKTIDSRVDANKMPTPPENRPKQQAFAKKSVTVRSVVRTPNGDYRLKMPNGAMQQKQQQQQPSAPPPPRITQVTPAPARTASVAYPKLPTVKQTQPNPVQQPVKLWNNMMSKATVEPSLKVHVSTRNSLQGFTAIQENPVENDANDGTSLLKIGQVFEGVSDDFVEDLFLETAVPSSPSTQTMSAPTPPSTPQPLQMQPLQSSSPLLDTLVKEMEHDPNNGIQTATVNDDNVKLVTIVQNDDKSCADYRCNICLNFNDSKLQYREHMLRKHGFRVICERCHDAFNHQQAFIDHFKYDSSDGVGSMKCALSANANRTYICIVEPPIILMRNEKVFAFRCKYCDLAFQNQRNYVQHAQRHAKLFRCKQCPTKPLNIDLMREHLTHHKN